MARIETPREVSPYRLMQEEYRDDGWKLLVGCICLNLVSARTARPVWHEIFRRWPDPQTFHESATREELVGLLRPLGFQNRRAERILRMTEGWLDQLRKTKAGNERDIDVSKLYGVGKYAEDSFNLFVKGYLSEDVEDKELLNYVRWALSRREETR